MADLWSKFPMQKLWQIFKSASMQNFAFSVIPKYFFQLLFPSASEIKRKRNFKIGKGSRIVFSASVQQRIDSQPNFTRQPLSFMGGNCYAPNPIPRPLPFQTCPLHLLLAVLPAGEIMAMPRAKVLRPNLCELPIASSHQPSRLQATGVTSHP
jgi:hypothetical protein